MKKQYFLFLSFLSLLGACAEDPYNSSSSLTAEGEVALQLNADAGKTGIAITGASAKSDESSVSVDDFLVQVLDASQKVVKSWPRYADMPESVRLNVASYTMKASYGNPTAVGFDKPYFVGTKAFTVSGQQVLPLSMTCALGNSKVAVVFGGNIATEYTDYYAEVTSSGNDRQSILFAKNETRAAYFPAGDLQLTIYMVNAQNQVRVYKPATVAVEPKDFMTLTLDSKNAMGNLSLTISTVTDTEDKSVEVEIPGFMLPKGAPTLSYDGFAAETGILAYPEAVAQTAKANLRADGGIKSCELTVSQNLKDLGWPDGVDLATISSENATLLKNKGLAWFEGMKGEVFASVDYSGVTALLAAGSEATSYSFTLKVTDTFDQVTSKTMTLTVEPPVMSVAAIAAGNVWAARVENVVVNVTAGDPTRATLQYKTTGAWMDCVESARNVNGTAVTLSVKSLPASASAQTDITFRAKYNAHTSNEVSTSLEQAAQIGNSGFEHFTASTVTYKAWASSYTQPTYAPSDVSEAQWWACNNAKSCNSSIATTPAAPNRKCFPTVSYTTSAKSGGKAAQLATIGLDNGGTASTIAGTSYVGEMWIGTEDGSGNRATEGHVFASRPSKLQFYCNFDSYESESYLVSIQVKDASGNTIGSAESSENASTSSQWVLKSVDITYTNSTAKAAKILMTIKASTGSGKKLNRTIEMAGTNYDGVCYGSCLKIDDMALLYE
ncbi:MAG: DUF4493 domain-containing protein [Alistipes sp.]|nr:DUF4493 domain-containing protein [Alistipes sp.]